jgi:hypothetical protein
VKRPNGKRTRHRCLTALPLPLMVVVGIVAGSQLAPGPWNNSFTGWLQLVCVSLVMTFMVRWDPGARHGAIHARRTIRRNSRVYQSRGIDEFK